MKPENAFAAVLRDLRTENNISQEALALKCGLDRTYISLLERGRRQPSLTTILKIAAILGVEASEMIARVQKALSE